MKRFVLSVSSLLLLLIGSLTIQAQPNRTITEQVSSSEQFEVLTDALQAAELAATLDDPDAQFTVFAPTDAAFEAALGELGLSAEDLLGDAEMLARILQYHVVEGAFFSDDLSAGDVQTVAGAPVTIAIASDGTITVNDAEVTTPDVEARNGVIHVIDSVLVPPAAASATAETPADTPAATPADDTAADAGAISNVRFIHFAPDAPAVDIYADGDIIIGNLAYTEASAFGEFPASSYEIAIAPADTSIDDAVIGPVDLVFTDETYTTIAVVGSLENGTLAPTIFLQDTVIPIPDGEATVTIAHAIEGAPAVDIYANGELLVSELAFASGLDADANSTTIDLPAGTYDLSITAAGDQDAVLLSAGSVALESNTLYLIAAIGTPDAPTLQIIDVAFPDAPPQTTADPDSDPERTVLDIITETEGFVILTDAIEAAELGSTLSDTGTQYTVFAPDDTAFENALGDLGLTASELLQDDATLQRVLGYHVVEGALSEADLQTRSTLSTLSGDEIQVDFTENGIVLNGAVQIVASDLQASNGIVHTIDAVLLPGADEE